MPVRLSTLMSVAFLDSAARTAISQVGVSTWISSLSLRSVLVRECSCPYRTTGQKGPGIMKIHALVRGYITVCVRQHGGGTERRAAGGPAGQGRDRAPAFDGG